MKNGFLLKDNLFNSIQNSDGSLNFHINLNRNRTAFKLNIWSVLKRAHPSLPYRNFIPSNIHVPTLNLHLPVTPHPDHVQNNDN